MDKALWIYTAAFGISFLLALVLTPAVRTAAVKTNCVANPREDRWHKKKTGLFGGVAIFASVLASWLFTAAGFMGTDAAVKPLLPIIPAGCAVFALGLVDDIFKLNPQYKLTAQVVIASLVVFAGFQVNWLDSVTANILISIFWIVGITNAFNLLDNMDGLAGGIALISGFFLFLWIIIAPDGFQQNQQALQLVVLAYLGGIAGFLVYNFNPASIFMGDAGSLFIGFMLSVLMIAVNPAESGGPRIFNQLSVIFTPILILFVPILDTAFVSLTRKLRSRSIFQGGTDHSSHRMVAVGLSEKKAVWVLYGFSILSGLIAIAIIPIGIFVSIMIISVYLLLAFLFWLYLGSVDVYPQDRQAFEYGGFSKKITAEQGKTLLKILLDLVLITMAYYAAYLLRFEGDIGPDVSFFLKSLPIMFACQVSAFYFFGLYHRVWKGARLGDIPGYFYSVTAGTVAAMLVLLFLYRFQYFSRAVFVIYWGIMLILVTFSRSFFNFIDEALYRASSNGKPALVYGAGFGGSIAVREIENNPRLGLTIKGFIDDDPKLKGKRVYGYPVYGGIEDFERLAEKLGIQVVVISFKTNSHEQKKNLARICTEAGLQTAVKQLEVVLA